MPGLAGFVGQHSSTDDCWSLPKVRGWSQQLFCQFMTTMSMGELNHCCHAAELSCCLMVVAFFAHLEKKLIRNFVHSLNNTLAGVHFLSLCVSTTCLSWQLHNKKFSHLVMCVCSSWLQQWWKQERHDRIWAKWFQSDYIGDSHVISGISKLLCWSKWSYQTPKKCL